VSGAGLQVTTEAVTANRELMILADAKGIAHTAAAEFLMAARQAVSEKGCFRVVLTGGSTLQALYELLGKNRLLQAMIPWSKMQLFFGDEWHVPPDHRESNFRMVKETMLAHVPVDRKQVHRIKGEMANAVEAAEEYEQQLRASFELKVNQLPRFDLILLGMGREGDRASVFPGTEARGEESRLAVGYRVGELHRITLTLPVLNNAARVIFMARGAEKAPALRAVLEGSYQPQQLPAQMIRPKTGRVLWLVDVAAAAMLKSQTN